jgi:hypothetical protein
MPAVPAARRDRRPVSDSERPLPAAIEPSARALVPLLPQLPQAPSPTAPTLPRWIEPERDYRSPTPIERARLLRAAYESCAADAEQRLLIAELMAHYRAWCLRNGKGDPFAGLSRD